MRCQCLRFIIIDEISMVSAELLAQLDLILRKVVRARSGYRRRCSDGSIRAFGGINVITFGDWWQLRPVRNTAIFSNRMLRPSGMAAAGLDLFWGTGPDAIRCLKELTRPMRCEDVWYNSVLAMCRQGALSFDT